MLELKKIGMFTSQSTEPLRFIIASAPSGAVIIDLVCQVFYQTIKCLQESSTTVLTDKTVEFKESPVEKKSAVKFQDEASMSEEEDGPPEGAPAPLIDMSKMGEQDDDVYSDDGKSLKKIF